jgi:hypothetical protein
MEEHPLEEVPAHAMGPDGLPAQWWLDEEAEELRTQEEAAEADRREYAEWLANRPAVQEEATGWIRAVDAFGGAPRQRTEAESSEVSSVALCSHCAIDPVQTARDGLCRNCKNYQKRHQGQLPPEKVVESRRWKRGIQ